MSKVEGVLSDAARLLIYDTQSNALIINEARNAGAFSYPGLTSYDKHVMAVRDSDGKMLGFGRVTPAGEDPVEATYNVMASGDDGYVTSSDFRTTNNDIAIGGGDRKAWTRFTGIPIPQGSSIEAAFIRLRITSAGSNFTRATLQAKADDNAPAPTSRAGFNGWGLTTASVSWTISHGPAGTVRDSDDISAIIQEIISRPGWVAGNAIAMVYTPTGDGYDYYAAFDHSTYAQPELHVRFVAP